MSTVFIKSHIISILEKAIWWNVLMDQTPHSGFVLNLWRRRLKFGGDKPG
ncbi:hypothetical protein HanIR_Chr02g0068841 [Helianthus annuus]|nr:hypothetical protein HanIR_Chr02g0068841 [Helianthus annuus]